MKTQPLTLRILFLLIIYCSVILPNIGTAQTNHFLARGADTAEIYVTSYWYKVPSQLFGWGGIFRSQDNGATLTLQHKYNYEKNRHEIYGDSISGTIYLQHYAGLDTLMVSHDFGITFNAKFIDFIGYVKMASGCMSGELYTGPSISYPGLSRFTHYGDSSYITNLNADSLLVMDVGSLPGELYAQLWPYSWPINMDTLGIAYSSDYGQHFSVIYQDTGLISYKSNYTFTRGTDQGELYITGKDTNDCYHIFHSTDNGQTLELKQITQPLLACCEDISFTAGRAPGSFYMSRVIGYSSYHADLWIYYSSDFGATFTTYYHSLDSTLTGVVRKEIIPELKVFPNPATEQVTIRTEVLPQREDAQITLYDLLGKPVAMEILPKGQPEMALNVRNLAQGVYYYVITQNQRRQNGKLVIVK